MPILVYSAHKIKENGICTYRKFEGLQRKMHKNSLLNLEKKYKVDVINKDYVEVASDNFLQELKESGGKLLSYASCKKIAEKCRVLEYYSKERKFISQKSGMYKMKVAFLTLTAPKEFTSLQIDTAFRSFLEYLHRTANCEYVYKKEVGEESQLLHYHLMINNFIPFYIVNWKWTKLLLNQSNEGMYDENNKLKSASTRIELPKSKKGVVAYIAKYMSKSQIVFENVGNLWGCSENLKKIEHPQLIENDISSEEFKYLFENNKVIRKDFMTFVCVNPLSLAKFCPNIYAVFRPFFDEIQERISHAQKFHQT